MKGFFKSFWGGFTTAFVICFVISYFAFPKPSLDEEMTKGSQVELPEAGSDAGIYYPQQGDTISGVFIVYGAGHAFENQAMIELVDNKDQSLISTPIYFHSPDVGITGPFITSLDLTHVNKEGIETGKIILYDENQATGAKQIIDDVNVRIK